METVNLQQQIIALQTTLNGYESLLRAEYLKFQNGESSLFLINSRESKLLEIAEKLVMTRIKYFKAQFASEWAAGLLK